MKELKEPTKVLVCYFTSLTESSLYGNDGKSGKVELLIEGVTREIEMPMTYYTELYHIILLSLCHF